jgi:UDP-N-acetylmuramoyl-L-alanyl-D-glutamate--2,6-diaminopimelate ligase
MMAAARSRRGRTVGELLGDAAGAHANLAITDLTLDSRQVTPGAAFVALAGAREHGLSYAAQALAQGAAIVLYEPSPRHAAVPQPSIAVPRLRDRLAELAQKFFVVKSSVITGVTGTNGKTTVAYLLAQALSRPQRSCAYIGTLGFGVPPRLSAHGLTTPDCLTLHRELAALSTPQVAMEVSSHALAQDRVAGLKFHTAVFTNLTRDHLDEHGDFASYGAAKVRLFRRPGLEYAVVNANDPFATTLAAELPGGCALLRTSLQGRSPADLVGYLVRSDLSGVELTLSGRFGDARLRSPLIGDFNAENLLVVLGALLAAGLPLAAACEALGTARAAPGRMEVVGGPPDRPWVVVDYAHTPDALQRTLSTLKSIAPGELVCVFGCGGDRDRGKRPLMGEIAERLSGSVVLTDDNPRGEDPRAIVDEILEGIQQRGNVRVLHDRRAAIHAAITAAHPGDAVLIAGKGHESMQVMRGESLPFSDRAVAIEALGGRNS